MSSARSGCLPSVPATLDIVLRFCLLRRLSSGPQSGGGSVVARFPVTQPTNLIESFRQHSEAKFLIQPFSDSLLDVAFALLDGYALKGYDAMQLAGYLLLRSISGAEEPVFVCADKALLSAARSEGCPIMDPSSP